MLNEHQGIRLSRLIDGPAAILQRISAALPELGSHLHDIDSDYWLQRMAESDPEYIAFLHSEGLLRKESEADERMWLS